ncbi:MAG: preprotein translocase subunit SecG [Clostridia bacterium]|nr:preprotein translocase subunit SecG [Clostridia bacterium]
MISFLNSVPAWVATSFPIIRYVLMFLIAAAAIVLIIVTLMQEHDDNGSANAITGMSESYYSQNKGETTQGKLKKITIAMAATIAVSIVLFFVTMLVYAG